MNITDHDSTDLQQLREKIYEEIEDIASEKAEDYKEIAEKDHYMLPGEALGLPVEIDEIAEWYDLKFEEDNAREIAEHTVFVYFMNEDVLREHLLNEDVEAEPSSFAEHLKMNASKSLQRTICRLYKEIHPYEWDDQERQVREALEIHEGSEFPTGEVASSGR